MNTFSTSYMGNAIALLNVTVSCYATADFTTATVGWDQGVGKSRGNRAAQRDHVITTAVVGWDRG